MNKFEIREFDINLNAGDSMNVKGLVNPTNTDSRNMGFVEKIQSGAFDRAIQRAFEAGIDIPLLNEHDKKMVLASTKNDTLRLHEDMQGLQMEATIVNTSYGKDVFELIKSGLLNSMSFGFKVLQDEIQFINGIKYRTVIDLELTEISVVSNPAYASSNIEARNMQASNETNTFKSLAIDDRIKVLPLKPLEIKEHFIQDFMKLENKVLADDLVNRYSIPMRSNGVKSILKMVDLKFDEELDFNKFYDIPKGGFDSFDGVLIQDIQNTIITEDIKLQQNKNLAGAIESNGIQQNYTSLTFDVLNKFIADNVKPNKTEYIIMSEDLFKQVFVLTDKANKQIVEYDKEIGLYKLLDSVYVLINNACKGFTIVDFDSLFTIEYSSIKQVAPDTETTRAGIVRLSAIGLYGIVAGGNRTLISK